MRSFVLPAIFLLLTLPATGCREDKAPPTVEPLPPLPAAERQGAATVAAPPSALPAPPAPASSIAFGDPTASAQLGPGFHSIESGWRWTEQKFSLTLGVPAGAKEKGGVLRLKFSLPKSLLDKLKKVTLEAKVGSASVSKSFVGPDAHVLELEVPASALTADSVVVEVATDKPFSPGGQDIRILGVLALAAELVSK